MPASNLWVVTGPSGAGKSRVGNHLHDELGLTFIEGDDFLDDEDKLYLATHGVLDDARHAEVREDIITTAINEARRGDVDVDVVVACSALRVADRDAWRDAVKAANSSYPAASGQEYEFPLLSAFPLDFGDLYHLELDAHDPSFQQGVVAPDLVYQDLVYPPTLADEFEDAVTAPRPVDFGVSYHDGFEDAYHLDTTNANMPYHPTTADVAHPGPAPNPHPLHLHIIYLSISETLSRRTVKARRRRSAHFMVSGAVPAQFRILEPPGKGERDCIVVPSFEAGRLKAVVAELVGGWGEEV